MAVFPHLQSIKSKKMIKLTLASWKVRMTVLTHLHPQVSQRPQWRTALVARELAHYCVDIAACSESHFSDKGQLTEIGGSYTFFWIGHSNEEQRETEVGFVINQHLVKQLDSILEGLNDCLIKLIILPWVGGDLLPSYVYVPMLQPWPTQIIIIRCQGEVL